MLNNEWVKPFALRHDSFSEIKGDFGIIFVTLSKINVVNCKSKIYWPYGISSSQEFFTDQLYLSAEIRGKVEDPNKRDHYLVTFRFPGIEKKFIGGDVFDPLTERVSFEKFYIDKSITSWRPAIGKRTFFYGKGGRLLIPNDNKIIKGIELSLLKVSLERWEKGPWSLLEASLIAKADCTELMEKLRRVS